MEGEVLVHTAESCNEVIFEGADGALCGITAVHARGNQLIIDIFCAEKLLKGFRALIVKTLEFGAQSSSAKAGMDSLVAMENGRAGVRRQWFSQNIIAVIVVDN